MLMDGIMDSKDLFIKLNFKFLIFILLRIKILQSNVNLKLIIFLIILLRINIYKDLNL